MQAEVLVVGAGAAGVDIAAALRQELPNSNVILVSPDAELLYRPWLVYLPVNAVPYRSMAMPLADIASRYGFTYKQASVRAVQPDENRVILESGDEISYRYLVLTPGAPADRNRIPGAAEHALFPCDAPEAMRFISRVGQLTNGTVHIILTGERIGPGLEYAGWLGRALRETSERSVRVVLLDDADAMDKQFGAKAAARLQSILRSRGVEVVRNVRVDKIRFGQVVLDDGSPHSADLIAITSPLRGPDLGLPVEVLDDRAMVKVDRCLRMLSHGNVFAAGDFANIDGSNFPKTWLMARMQAQVAVRNVAAALSGGAPRDLNMRKFKRAASLSMPDVGGTTLFVRNRRPVFAGRWPLEIRYRMDAKYLGRYRMERDVTRPHFISSS